MSKSTSFRVVVRQIEDDRELTYFQIIQIAALPLNPDLRVHLQEELTAADSGDRSAPTTRAAARLQWEFCD